MFLESHSTLALSHLDLQLPLQAERKNHVLAIPKDVALLVEESGTWNYKHGATIKMVFLEYLHLPEGLETVFAGTDCDRQTVEGLRAAQAHVETSQAPARSTRQGRQPRSPPRWTARDFRRVSLHD